MNYYENSWTNSEAWFLELNWAGFESSFNISGHVLIKKKKKNTFFCWGFWELDLF